MLSGDGEFSTRLRQVADLDVSATLDADRRSLQLAVINRSPDTATQATVELDNAALPAEAIRYTLGADCDDVFATNIAGQASVATVRHGTERNQDNAWRFPPHSVTLLSFTLR